MVITDNPSRRRVLRASGALVLTGGLASGASATAHDGHDSNGDDGDTGVRAAHLSPDAPNVDVFLDGDLVLEDVSFGTISDYLALAPGSYDILVVPAGGTPDDAVIDETVEVGDGAYTIAAVGEVTGENHPLQSLMLRDDTEPVESGAARIRLVHASPDAPAVDVVAGENGDPLFEDVAFGEYEYVEVPADEYPIRVYPAGNRSDPVSEVDVTLEGERAYTAFAVGYVDPTDAPVEEPFEILLTEDTVTGHDDHAHEGEDRTEST